MSNNVTGSFATRRAAEMAVERLVQEFSVERTDIFISADGEDNSAGVEAAGSDNETARPSVEGRDDGAHHGGIIVSVDVNDSALIGRISGAFEEFDGTAELQDK